MKLVIVGSGYVGLVTGVFSEFGYKTICVDKDQDRINQLNSEFSILWTWHGGFTKKTFKKYKIIILFYFLVWVLNNADIVFITVGTPSRRLEDDADLKYVWAVAEEISNNIKKYCLVVTKSTVPLEHQKK